MRNISSLGHLRRPAAFATCALTLGAMAYACGGDDNTDPAAATTVASSMGGMGGDGVGGFDLPVGGNGPGGSTTMSSSSAGGQGEPGYVWDEIYGGTGKIYARDVAVDQAGNIIVVGSFTQSAGESVDLGGGPLSYAGLNDIFVAKFDSTGGHIWSRSFGDGDDDGAIAVDCDNNNDIFITGNFKGLLNFGSTNLDAQGTQFPDTYVAKLSGANGNELWAQSFGVGIEESDYGNALSVDPSGNVVITGMFQSYINFGGVELQAAGGEGDYSMFVAKFNPSGAHLYSEGFGGTGKNEAYAAATNAAHIAIGGYTEGAIDFGGGSMNPGDGPRAAVALLDSSGGHIFSYAFPSDDEAEVQSLAFAPNGDLVVAGNFRGSMDVAGDVIEAAGGNDDIFVARFDTTGAPQFVRRIGSATVEKVGDIGVDSNGYTLIAGFFKGEFQINSSTILTSQSTANDMYLLRLGPPGYAYWGFNANAVQTAQGLGLVVLPNDDIVTVGNFSGELDLGSGAKGSGASVDFFLAQFAAEGDGG